MTDNHSMGEVVRTLERIEAQVTKTNGRVSALEKWRWVITGGMIAVGAISVPNISAIVQAFVSK